MGTLTNDDERGGEGGINAIILMTSYYVNDPLSVSALKMKL